MNQHPDVGLAGSSLENSEGISWPFAFRFPSLLSELESGIRLGAVTKLLSKWVVSCEMSADEPGQIDWVPGASLIIRREVFDSIGLMDEDYFLYYEETDFCLQARRSGWSCWYVPQSRVMHIAGQSTGVTSSGPPRRLPQYWFDSRRRYFVKNHGFLYAALADTVWMIGFASWRLRRAIQRKPDADPPKMLNDFLFNSVFFKGSLG